MVAGDGDGGRWDRGDYLWECPGCGCALCSRTQPAPDRRECTACAAIAFVSQAHRAIIDLHRQCAHWRDRAVKAESQLDEQCDQINELRTKLSTATTEPAPSSGERSA